MSVAGLRGRLVAAITLVAAALGCGGGGDGGTTPTGGNPSISISLSASALSVTQGAAGTVTVNLTRSGGFAGDVAVSVSGGPTGVTIANATIAAGQTSATLNISAAATAAAGTSTLTVTATGSGVSASSATLTLTVAAAQTQAGSITLSVSPSTLSIAQGANGQVTVTINRTNFTGAVNLAVSGAPANVTTALSAASVTGNTATLTVDAAAAAAAGNSTLTITASGTGISNASATVALTVTAAQAAGSIALSASPATVSVAQGATGNVTININRTNFTGAVNLAVSGAPANITPTLSATSVTGNTATLTLAAGATAALGNSTITITGSGTGISNATTTVALTVTAAQSSGGNTGFKFCGKTGIPLWVAAQDGTGNWQRITGSNDTYSFNISGKGGLAYVINSNAGFELDVIYGTSAEIQQISLNLCNDVAGAGKAVTAPISGAAAGDIVLASLGTSAGTVTSNTSVAFAGVQPGNVDLIAGKTVLSLSGTSFSFDLQKMIIRRGLNPASGSALSAIDFNGAEAFAPVSRALTFTNLNGEVSALVMGYLTANTYAVAPYFTNASLSGGAPTYPGVPAGSQAAGDLHLLTVSAFPSLTNSSQTRNVIMLFKDAVPKTVTFGPAMTAPTVSALSATGYGRARASVTLQPEYNRHLSFDVQQTGNGIAYRRTYIQMTSGYHGGTSPVVMDIPDFSSVAGFDPNWGLKTGVSGTWTVAGTGWTGGTGGQPPYVEGGVYQSGTRQGNVTP